LLFELNFENFHQNGKIPNQRANKKNFLGMGGAIDNPGLA
jgi:hypothetical protein